MSDVIGRGVIEVSADSTKLKAGIADAKRTVKDLGKATGDAMSAGSDRASRSIDRYIQRLELAAATQGRSAREAKLYELALRGATAAQLASADAALRMSEAYERDALIGERFKAGLATLGTLTAAAAIGAVAAFDQLIKKAGDFQDMAEKTGDTAENIASLAVAAGTAGASMDEVASASVRLTKNLTGVDDDSKAAGAAIKALGLNLDEFKNLRPADQLETVAKAFNSFQDGPQKAAVAMALFGKAGAELLPFFKELASEGGRQVILTQQQIQAADAYADAQARLRTELSLQAQVLAAEALPTLNAFADALRDISKDQAFTSAAGELMKAALAGLTTVFQTIIVLGSDVAFVFRGIYTEVVGLGKQLGALAKLDIKSFTAISDAMKADAERARAELDRFQARILAIGSASALSDVAATAINNRLGQSATELARRGRGGKPELQFEGATKTATGGKSVDQIAKARMAAEVDAIRNALNELTNTYGNAEKILEAQRAAGLLSEKEYYDAKRGFIALNSHAQIKALEGENTRLAAEKVGTKERIDNDKKIADNLSKIAILRANATASVEVLAIQEQAALTKLQRAYAEAEAAAQSYLDTLIQAQQRELAGIGQGRAFRDHEGGRQQILDRFAQQRQQLEGDRRRGAFDNAPAVYQQELDRIERFQAASLASYERYYAQRLDMEQSFQLGASEALSNYIDDARNTFKQTEDLVTNAFMGMEDALVQFVQTGKLDFKSLADSILGDITRIIIKQQLAKLAESALAGSKSGEGLWGSIFQGLGNLLGSGRAIGGPVSAGRIYPVNERGPELLNVAGRQYLMMGNQNGTVQASAPAAGNTVNVTLNQTFGQNTDRRTMSQAAAEASRALQAAGRNL